MTEPAWQRLTPVHTPPARAGGILVEMPGKGLFLFGGNAMASGYQFAVSPDQAIGGNVWKWDGEDWTDTLIPLPSEVHAAPIPPYSANITIQGGYRGSAAYDSDRGVVVWHLGFTGPIGIINICYTTVEFDGTAFTVHTNTIPRQIVANQPPNALTYPDRAFDDFYNTNFGSFDNSMAYDNVRKKMVLWPGSNAGFTYQSPVVTAWEWNTTTHIWDPQTPPPFPANPSGFSACFHPVLARMYGFGAPAGGMYGWHGDGIDSTDAQLITQTPPVDVNGSDGRGCSLIWNPIRQKMVLKGPFALSYFTPQASTSPPLTKYQNGIWTEILTGNDPWVGLGLVQPYAAMAHDSVNRVTVLFGGQMVPPTGGPTGGYSASADTWVLADPAPVSIAVTSSGPLFVGGTSQLTAIATYADTHTLDVTLLAQWSSASTAIATVSAAGVALGKSDGVVTFTATFDTVAATLTLTVPKLLSAAVSTPPMDGIIVIPTSTNFILLAAKNISANLRAQQAASMTLPSLYKRAYLVAYETDEIAVVKP